MAIPLTNYILKLLYVLGKQAQVAELPRRRLQLRQKITGLLNLVDQATVTATIIQTSVGGMAATKEQVAEYLGLYVKWLFLEEAEGRTATEEWEKIATFGYSAEKVEAGVGLS